MAKQNIEVEAPTILGKKVSPNVAHAVSAFSASITAEGRRREKMGLSGAGFAAGFADAMSPIIDYSKIMRGKADPGTILGRVGKKVMDDNQRFSVADAAKAAGKAAADASDDEPVDPLDLEPELGTDSIVMSDVEVANAAKAAVDAALGSEDPFEGVTRPDRQIFNRIGLGGAGMPEEELIAKTNYLTNRYGAKKTGELVQMIQEQGSVVYDEQGQAQDPFSIFAMTDDIPASPRQSNATSNSDLDTNNDGIVSRAEARKAVKK